MLTFACLLCAIVIFQQGCRVIPSPTSVGPAFVPWPKQVTLATGRMPLGGRIVTQKGELLPLATVMAEEGHRLTGRTFTISSDVPRPGDIVLELDPALRGEIYTLTVDEKATVRGGSYAAVAAGSVTLWQALEPKEGHAGLPRLTVHDEPFAGYRGLMIDLSNTWHTPETLIQMVLLCRWYKICFLHLHLTDNQSFTFPSTAYPTLATPGRHYTLAQLGDLERFASARGVTLIPELGVPGHSEAAVRALPALLDCSPPSKKEMCPGRPETYKILDTLIGEMCAVFKSAPYFHLGADEVTRAAWAKCRYCRACLAENKLGDTEELYRLFIVRMNEAIKKHGKTTIVWEGFARRGKVPIPRDIKVMVFECLYNLPGDLIQDGYDVINTTWKPLYLYREKCWSPEYIYSWNMFRWENWLERSKALHGLNVEPTPQVLGAQICTWAQPDAAELPSLRRRVPAMSERIWNPSSGRTVEDFLNRLEVSDARLTKMLNQ